MKNNLYYIANIRIPTEKAHGIQIMKMCEAFSKQGIEVALIVPNRKNHIKADPFAYYKVNENFKIKKLPCIDTVKWGRFGFWLETLSFGIQVILYSMFKEGIFYTRDESISALLKFFDKRVIWEAHRGSDNFFTQYLVKCNTKIVTITKGLKAFYLSKGAKEENIYVSPDAVDLQEFVINENKTSLKEKLGLSKERKTILYTGHLYSWKGANTLAQAGKEIPKADFVFIGGTEKDISEYKKEYANFKNVKFLGHISHSEIPQYLKAADILVIPNSGKEDISRLYTSPMKLFEYMASMTPMIVSNLPSMREIVNESMVTFFEADNFESLAESINKVLENDEEPIIKAGKAFEEVKNYTWDIRAKQIYNFIQ